MNTRSLSRSTTLELFTHSARAAFDGLRRRWAVHAEYRRLLEAERELSALDARTLQDIGAPQGLIGQSRWQDERERSQAERLLDLRGW